MAAKRRNVTKNKSAKVNHLGAQKKRLKSGRITKVATLHH